MDVSFVDEAEDELLALPAAEYAAMLNALEKLEAFGNQLSFPHSSAVKGTQLRELRPRAGRSAWRAFYRRIGDQMVIGSIGPEALVDPRGFERAVTAAEQRLATVEDSGI